MSNLLSNYLVEQILLGEAVGVDKLVVVYSGRFQPFHKGHYATYSHLVKKFGKDNVFIATSNKTDTQKSPFNFKEKKLIISTMFGIPSSKVVEVKNPYKPVEILNQFNEETTSFITVVGEKDEMRLGGNYFEKWKDNKELEAYKNKGYVYAAPAQPNPISGTDVRNNLGKNVDDTTKLDFFSKRAYPKFNKQVYDLITKKLSETYEPIHIKKEVIEEWVITKFPKFINEVSQILASPTNKDVDDGPNFFFPNYDVFDKISIQRAEMLGMTVFKQIMDKEFEDYYEHPIYPQGPIGKVTFFPKGIDGEQTQTPSDDWFRHSTRAMALAGYTLVGDKSEIEKNLGITESFGLAMGYPSKEQLKQKMAQLKKLRTQLDTHKTGDEEYTPIKEDKIEGGLSAGMDLNDIANHHKVDIDDLMKEFQMGIKVEMEHTTDRKVAEEIAMDHLYENPKYYSKLSTIEKNEYGFMTGKYKQPAAQIGGLGDSEYSEYVDENIDIPVKIGDTILMGKFKNKKTVVKVIGTDEHGMPTINGKKVVTFRMIKEGTLNENIIVNILIKAIASAGVVVVRAFLPVFIDRVINGAMRTYQDIKDIVAPKPYIRFLKRLEKSDAFNKQFIEFAIQNKKGDNLIGNSWIKKITTLPAFVEEFDKFTTEEGIEGMNKSNLLHKISKLMWDAYLRNWKGIYTILKKKYPQLTNELPEGKLNKTPIANLIQSEALAVSGGKVHKYITGKNLTLKGKKYPDIEFEVLGIDNKLQLVKLKVLAPKSVFGQEMNVPFKTIRRGPFIKTDTNLTESQVDGGEPETGYIPDGKVRVVGSDAGRPEPWYGQGGYSQLHFPKADAMRGKGKNKDKESSFRKVYYKTSNVKVSTLKKALKPVGSDEWTEVPLTEGLLTEGGAYGHMNHPFDTEINLTFGQLKDIVNRALDGELELTREKTDGQALAISWVGGKLVAARNKGHLANKGANALDVKGVATKFTGRGELEKAYNFAMKDLETAVKALSEKQREKIFKDGACFMNLEVIYPTSVNVIPYGQALLVFHGTMEYNEKGEAIGENQQAASMLAGMIKQVNQNVQSTYTIQGPPVTKLPKSQKLSSLKGKYNGKITKLQSQFKLSDNAGVAEYHQAWWTNFVQTKSPAAVDNNTLIGLVKRWAFYDKGFRLDNKNITDPKVLAWAQKIDKEDHTKIQKDNLKPFEDIFLGVGSDVLSFMSSVLTANPNTALRSMKDRLDKMVSDVQKTGDVKLISKLKLELERLNSIGGSEKIVPNEGIVFVYGGNTMKLTGTFAPLNQILGMFYGK